MSRAPLLHTGNWKPTEDERVARVPGSTCAILAGIMFACLAVLFFDPTKLNLTIAICSVMTPIYAVRAWWLSSLPSAEWGPYPWERGGAILRSILMAIVVLPVLLALSMLAAAMGYDPALDLFWLVVSAMDDLGR